MRTGYSQPPRLRRLHTVELKTYDWRLVRTSALLQAEGAVALRPENAGRMRSLIADAETAALAERAMKSGATLVTPRGVLRGGPRG